MDDSRYFRSIAREQLLAVLDKNGLLIPDRKYETFVKNKIITGQRFCDTLIAKVIGPELYKFCKDGINKYGNFYHIEHLPRYTMFGYDVTYCFCRLFNIPQNIADRLTAAGAIANTFAVLFDRICDDYVELYPRLLHYISPDILLSKISLDPEKKNDFAEYEKNEPPLIKIVILLLREYFRRIMSIFSDVQDICRVRREFTNTILKLYSSELISINIDYNTQISPKRAYNILRTKSSLFVWLLVIPPVFMTDKWGCKNYVKIKKSTLMLGDVFWILDDIVDIVEDLRCGRWSYVTLSFADKILRDDVDSARVLDEIIERGIILSAAEKLCHKYQGAKKNLYKIGWEDNNFDKILLPWIRMWTESMRT